MGTARRLHVSLSIHYDGVGFTSAAVALAQQMPPPFEPIVYLPQVYGALPPRLAHVRPFPPVLPGKIANSQPIVHWARRRTERNLYRAVRREGRGAIVWLWPGASIDLQSALKSLGAIIIREMINTHEGTARRILDAEYARLGLPPSHGITEGRVRREQEQLQLANFIVSPSECVDASLREWGIADDKVIRSTFGWSPEKFSGDSKADLPGKGVKALFIGSVGVRKGIHLALEAWDRAGIDGTFVVVGNIDPEASTLLTAYRNRNDIAFLPFTNDVGSVFRAADFLFFPTLEEGAPLVCYESGGCGLPILTSPMGLARIVEPGVTGLVADPHDQEALTTMLRQIGSDRELRHAMAERIRVRAHGLDWKSAAADRARAFLERIG